MEEKDIPEVSRLYKAQCDLYQIYFKFSEEDIKHYFIPRHEVVRTYVVEDPDETGKLCDFFSFTYFF
jgi:glycylpeptide N-tetradecanoyltransferase